MSTLIGNLAYLPLFLTGALLIPLQYLFRSPRTFGIAGGLLWVTTAVVMYLKRRDSLWLLLLRSFIGVYLLLGGYLLLYYVVRHDLPQFELAGFMSGATQTFGDG